MSLLAAAFNSERFEQMELAPMTWRRLPGGNEPLLRAKREGGVAFAVVGHHTIGPWYELVVGAGAVHGSRISCCWWCAAAIHGNRPQRRCSSGITHSLRHTSSPLPVRPRHNQDNLLDQISSPKTLAPVLSSLSLVLSDHFTVLALREKSETFV